MILSNKANQPDGMVCRGGPLSELRHGNAMKKGRNMKMDRMIPMTRGAVALAETMVAVPGAFSVYADGLEARCADVFIKRMNGRGVAVSAGADSSAWIVIKKAALDHPEGYQLQIDADRVTIHAATERGAGWALTTLLLLMTAKSGGWEVPAAQISDAPAMRHRSLMLDVARHFFSAEEICKVIDAMSLAKLNTLHWNLTNDQGWRIESKRYPKLNEVNPEQIFMPK